MGLRRECFDRFRQLFGGVRHGIDVNLRVDNDAGGRSRLVASLCRDQRHGFRVSMHRTDRIGQLLGDVLN